MRALDPDLPVVLLTAWTHLETAVRARQGRRRRLLAKPWDDARLVTTVRNLLQLRAVRADERARQRAQRDRARAELAERHRPARHRLRKRGACTRWCSSRRRWRAPTCRCSITGPERRRARKSLAEIVQANSARARRPVRQASTSARCPTICSRASCSAPNRAPSPAPRRASAASRRRTAARCFSTRSATSRSTGQAQAAARAADRRVRAARVEQHAPGRRAHRLRHQLDLRRGDRAQGASARTCTTG